MEIDEKQIKDFSEFAEVAPTSTHNLITDKGRCSVGAFFEAMVDYASDKIDEATALAASKTDASAKAAASSAANAAKSATDADAAYDNGVALYNRAKTEAAEYVGSCSSAKAAAESARDAAVSAKTAAADDALKSEGYALGKQDGEAVGADSPYYQASAKYFADTAAEAKTAAETANTHAAAAKTAAELAQTKAEAPRTAAENAKSATDLLKTAAETAKAQSELARDQAIAAKTAAEAAAEVAQSTDAGQLMLSKSPQGFLAFTPLKAWKTQATLAKATKLTSSFSICFTACVDASEWAFYDTADYSALASTWLVQSQANSRGFHLAHLKYSNGIRVLRLNVKCRADSTAASHVDLPVSTFSDGKPHAVAFCAAPDSSVSSSGNNGKIRAYVDGVLQASNDAYLAEVPEQNGKLLFMNSLGRVARMCRFNFDISAADAPYTLADYTSGKAIPAALNAPFNFSADGSTWEPMKMSDNTTPAPATVSVAGDVITITTTAEIGEAFFRIKPTTDIIKGVAGQTLHVSVESFSGIGDSRGLGVKPMINDGDVGQINLTTNTKSGTLSIERPFNSVNLTIRYGTSPIPSGTVFTITGLRVWTNGSVVALDDYTFGGKIRDISGNDNHATVSTTNGVRIHGDKDEAVQQMYEAFSAQYTTDNP